MRCLCRWTRRLSLSSSLSVVVSLSSSRSSRPLSLDSGSLALSSTAHLDEESLHLSLRPVALLDEINWKEGRIKRHEAASKKRTVIWTDQETMAISGLTSTVDMLDVFRSVVWNELIVTLI
ncbi:hypothetical protein YC2023_113871 [Brassica napus]